MEERILNIFWQKLVFWISIGYATFNIYSLVIWAVPIWIHLSVNYSFCIFLAIVIYKDFFGKYTFLANIFDAIIIFFGIGSATYFAVNYFSLYARIYFSPTTLDILCAVFLIIAVLEANRKVNGISLSLVALSFIIYAIYGHNLPGILGHPVFSFRKIASFLYSDSGMYGTIPSIATSYIFLFILFGSFLKYVGGGDTFIQLATGLAGSYRGGPAKIAVIASAVFGTISGSSIANVVTTGSFTIPLMKKLGYKPEFAAGTEAMASTGGQIMPPIMGSAAFILAELCSVSYATVVLKALIPAILYFFALLVMVDIEAVKSHLKGLPKDELPDVKEIFSQKWPFLLPLIVIFISLLVFKLTPTRVATLAIFTVLLAPFISKGRKINIKKNILDALSNGALTATSVILSCLTASGIVAVLGITGLGIKIGNILLMLAGENAFLMLVAAAVLSMILGMGVPTVAAYIIASAVVGPALTRAGIPMVLAHLFVFYSSLLAQVTPPVAICAYAAAAIAKCSPVKAGFTGIKVGYMVFVMPFLFIYNPALAMEGSAIKIILSFLITMLAIVLIGFALQGFFFGKIGIIKRLTLMGSGILLFLPNLNAVLFSLILISTLILFNPRLRTTILKKITLKK